MSAVAVPTQFVLEQDRSQFSLLFLLYTVFVVNTKYTSFLQLK